MPQSASQTKSYAEELRSSQVIAALRKRLDECASQPLPERIPAGNDCSKEGVDRRRACLRAAGCCPELLCLDQPGINPAALKGLIENFIGFTHIPVGIIGPLRINGLFAQGDFFVPLATTEGALVASYHRGAYVASRSGGVTALCVSESLCRAPAFTFRSIIDAARFVEWAVANLAIFRDLAATTTRHGKLVDMKSSLNSNTAFLIFEFKTGDAAGQNMVTVATEKICEWITSNSPFRPEVWYVEGNLSGDKKATMLSFLSHRGRKVVAEAVVKRSDVKRFLHTTPEAMVEYCRISTIGGIQSGSIGIQGHYANALAALFLCCGQDVACLSEASVGITCMELTRSGDLYISVSLPNLTVGTVGGGTSLPGANECLRMLRCEGSGHARKFAEICAATVLAGEISIIAALSCGDFARAHSTFRRKSE